MKRGLRWVVMLAALAPPALLRAADQPLFVIERSKNANVVRYDARLGADGMLDAKRPVVAYWELLAEDRRREELSWIEKKMAYGFDVKADKAENTFRMTMVAVPERAITVKQAGGVARAEMPIDGQPAILEKLYINSTEGFSGPKVKFVELHGKDLQTAKPRMEKIIPR